MKCTNCSYEWETNSKMMYVTCPNCRLKTKNTLKEQHSKQNDKGETEIIEEE